VNITEDISYETYLEDYYILQLGVVILSTKIDTAPGGMQYDGITEDVAYLRDKIICS
jgi:hypothetical protein